MNISLVILEIGKNVTINSGFNTCNGIEKIILHLTDEQIQDNTKIPEIFGETRISLPPMEYFEFYVFVPLGAIASIYFLFNKGTYIEKFFSYIYIEEAILRIFYFSAFLHYVVFWLMVSVILTVMLFSKLNKI